MPRECHNITTSRIGIVGLKSPYSTVDVDDPDPGDGSRRGPGSQRGSEDEIVVVALSPVLITVVARSQVDLPTKVQELLSQDWPEL
jgi:hypothetical protein